MATCPTGVCGTGGWSGPLPGDPGNPYGLSAVGVFGGVDVTWNLPGLNPFAVAYTVVYRAYEADFDLALERGQSGSSHFFDRTAAGTYWYWIRQFSVNGTPGELVGPVMATAKPMIQDMLELLTDQIDQSHLANILKTPIAQIPVIELHLAQEVTDRLAANDALQDALEAVDGALGEAVTLIQNEVTTRTTQNAAVVNSLNTLAAGVDDNAAAIITERDLRVSADEALAAQVTTLFTEVDDAQAAIIAEQTARVTADEAMASDIETLYAAVGDPPPGGYASTAALETEATVRATADSALASLITTLEAEVDGNTAAIAAETSARASADSAQASQITTLQTNVAGAVASIAAEATTRSTADAALAASITTAQSTLAGSIASAQTTLQTNIDVVDGKVTNIGARWTAVVDVNGLIGGFGVYNTGTTVDAGFDVDTFWVGRTTLRVKPFIISGGIVYINEAAIGQVSANFIDTRGLLIRNAAGQVIFGAGATVNPSTYMSVPAGWLNSNITVDGSGYMSGIGTGGVPVDNRAAVIGQNLLPNSDMAQGHDWAISYSPNSAVIDVGPRFARGYSSWSTADFVMEGAATQSLFVRQAGVAPGSADGSGDTAVAVDIEPFDGVACSPGQRVCGSAYLHAHRCDGQVLVTFHGPTGALVGSMNSTTFVGTIGSPTALANMARVFVMGTVPAGAVLMRLRVRKLNTRAGQADSYFWWAGPMLGPIGALAAVPDPYMPGPPSSTRQLGFSGDLNATYGATFGSNIFGQINGVNVSTYIATAAIGAAQIGSLDAAVINAGTITTDKLVVGAVTAAQQSNRTISRTVYTGVSSFTKSEDVITMTCTGAPVTFQGAVEVRLGNASGSGNYIDPGVYMVGLTVQVHIDGVFKWEFANLDFALPNPGAVGGKCVVRSVPVLYREALAAGSHTFTVKVYAQFFNGTGNLVNSNCALDLVALYVAQENKV